MPSRAAFVLLSVAAEVVYESDHAGGSSSCPCINMSVAATLTTNRSCITEAGRAGISPAGYAEGHCYPSTYGVQSCVPHDKTLDTYVDNRIQVVRDGRDQLSMVAKCDIPEGVLLIAELKPSFGLGGKFIGNETFMNMVRCHSLSDFKYCMKDNLMAGGVDSRQSFL